MLVLCSDGLTSPALLQAVREKLPQNASKAALVVTADRQYKKRNHHLPVDQAQLEALGLVVELFDLDHEPAEALLDYDAVDFIGGNPFYLLYAIRKKQAEPVLSRLAAEKALIGWSAGAIVFGPTLELIREYTPEMDKFPLPSLDGLGLCPHPVLPHYSSFLGRFERFEERCRDFEQRSSLSVLRLSDGEGAILDGDERKIIRI